MSDVPRITPPERRSGGGQPASTRSRSAISFPYADLSDTEAVVEQVWRSGGHCEPAQLAAWLGHSKVNSGAFRNKVAAGRLFGVVARSRRRIELTALGLRLAEGAEGERRRQARVEAFLAVPLYRTIFEEFRGRPLPSSIGLEVRMVALGVSPTQVRSARQVLMRSARQAGFTDSQSADRQLVLPRGCSAPGDPPAARPGGGPFPQLIEAVLDEAPWGSTWSEEAFEQWADYFVKTARYHFRLGGDRSS